MAEIGVVRSFDAEQGWGVIDSPATPGGCFVHFSAVERVGYRALAAGDRVEFDHEPGPQDEFDFRATRVHKESDPPYALPPAGQGGGAYSSTLTITYDDARDLRDAP